MTKKQLLISKCFEFGKRDFDVNETLTLLRGYTFKFWSWGVSNVMNLQNKVLMFKVNGHHHKGYVVITLDWDDTYCFHLVTNNGDVKHEETNVYFDELFDRIDVKVERIDEYTR